jgi:hypothetical protein
VFWLNPAVNRDICLILKFHETAFQKKPPSGEQKQKRWRGWPDKIRFPASTLPDP